VSTLQPNTTIAEQTTVPISSFANVQAQTTILNKTNAGTQTYTIELYRDNTLIATKQVSVDNGSYLPVFISVNDNVSGVHTYKLVVDTSLSLSTHLALNTVINITHD
jgi:hypothetical protein